MNILSLFDGMSCGRIALDRAGIKVNNYYASEIDKYAISVAKANWPATMQLGDATNWRSWSLDWSSIDLLIGGSPCQGFSFAGKQLAFDDPRSKLFFVYVDILNHIKSLNPNVKFMLENVRMKKEHLAVISYHIGVEPVFINSALVSAQNRQRYYWANWDFGQPDDKGIVLADIIEDGQVDRDKGHCIDANYFKGGNLKSYFEKNRRQLVFANPAADSCRYPLIAQKGRGNNPGGLRALDGKTPAMTACSWQDNNHLVFGAAFNRKDGLGKPIDKAYSLNASDWRGLNRNQTQTAITNGIGYRKLTPIECERLQTVPENYTNHVSKTQRYKMLGNGWTVDVIAHIFTSIKE